MAETFLSHIDAEETGKIKHTMYADVLDVFRVIGHHIPTLLGSAAVILASLLLAAFYDFRLMLFILGALILGTLLSVAGKKMITLKAGNTTLKLKEHHMLCDQYVDSIPLVQTNPVLPYFMDKTRKSIGDFIATSQKEDGVQVFWTEAVSHYNTLFHLALSTFLALPAAGGSIVNLVFFITLADIIMTEGQKSQLLIQQIIRAQVSFENVDKLRRLPKRQGTETLSQITGIVFTGVCFSYREAGPEVLHDISCTLQSGEILINGKRLDTYSQESLNEQILFVNQDEILLNESLLNYLELISGTSFDRKKAEEILQWTALAKEDITIENNGLSLSAGQRKKLLISKLLLRYEKASVIILDEPEAGLDQLMLQKYIAFLRSMFAAHKKIFLIVAHNIDHELPFDRVFQFENGQITESRTQ